ncbi:hypothetical protein [Tenacibaculum sp. IB213877]|uniref:hypothetical protein n=1 Tax=Tenacibaculum sp. IB213877 TaxID=3097351 RepID=UPI002A5A7870|nr:hypothetical protein [Tenacibaculum sp. IB213877]MDY0780952.1 hypothetical protein [Tenacibaculum sp. IB213877]
MFKQILLLISLFFLATSCKKNIQKVAVDAKKPEMNVVVKHKNYAALSSYSKKEIKNWKEYKDVEELLTRFENISPLEALNYAVELKDLTKKMKDSIKIKDFKTPAFKARVNVLENEALRLYDMTMIPAITAKEINLQIDKYILIFSSINEKINTIYQKKLFDEEIELEDFFQLDSIDNKQKTEPKTVKKPEKQIQRANPVSLEKKKAFLRKKSLLQNKKDEN